MLLALFAYSIIPTIILITLSLFVTLNIWTLPRNSPISQLLGLALILSTLFTATTGAILLAQSILA